MERCDRFPPSRMNMDALLRNASDVGWMQTPDYRPEPVIGARSFMPHLDLGFVLERDVQELRTIASESLLRIIATVQRRIADSTQIEVFRLRGAPNMPFFFRRDKCLPGTDCRYAMGTATSTTAANEILFQYGCMHCQLMKEASVDESRLHVLTPRTRLANCERDGALVAVQVCPRDKQSAPYFETANARLLSGRYHRPVASLTDNGEVVSSFLIVSNLSLGVRLSFAATEYRTSIAFGALWGALLGIALVALSVAAVLLLSNTTMNSLEAHWRSNLDKMRRARDNFDAVIQRFMVPLVSFTLMRDSRAVIAEQVRVHVAVLSFSGFTRTTPTWGAAAVMKLVHYSREIISAVAQHHELHPLHYLGDESIWIHVAELSGLSRGSRSQQQGKQMGPAAIALMSFVGTVMTLWQEDFVWHYPQASNGIGSLFSDLTKGNKRYQGLIPLRIGCHSGIGVASLLPRASTPQFDILGLPVGFARRVASASTDYRILVSQQLHEIVTSHDSRRAFAFEPGPRVVSRSGGQTTYQLSSYKLPRPANVMAALGMQPAVRDFPYAEDQQKTRGLWTRTIESYVLDF